MGLVRWLVKTTNRGDEMKQTMCDACKNVIIKPSKVGLVIEAANERHEDFCEQCSRKIFQAFLDIKNSPKSVCKECGSAH